MVGLRVPGMDDPWDELCIFGLHEKVDFLKANTTVDIPFMDGKNLGPRARVLGMFFSLNETREMMN